MSSESLFADGPIYGEMNLLEAFGIETPCCLSCSQDADYGPLMFLEYKALDGSWIEVEACCEHANALRAALIGAGVEIR